VIETVFESSIFPSKKDRAILFIYPVHLIVKPLPRACEAGPTLFINGARFLRVQWRPFFGRNDI
jgi:hypothetical protein